eukprot:5644976-Prymnesium_polylepis.2
MARGSRSRPAIARFGRSHTAGAVPPLPCMSRKTATRKATRAAAVGGEGEATKTKWSSFYWSDTKRNYKGETLSECMNGYGCGGW